MTHKDKHHKDRKAWHLEKIILSIFLLSVFFSAIEMGIGSGTVGNLKKPIKLERADYLVAMYEDVIARSKKAGIDTSKLESILTRTKEERGKLRTSIEKNNTLSEKSAYREIGRSSAEFMDGILKIREQQDKRDVERAMVLTDKSILKSENALKRLESRRVDTKNLKTNLHEIKRHSDSAKEYYEAGNYREALEELRKAREESSGFAGEVKFVLEARNLDF